MEYAHIKVCSCVTNDVCASDACVASATWLEIGTSLCVRGRSYVSSSDVCVVSAAFMCRAAFIVKWLKLLAELQFALQRRGGG